MSHQFIRMHSVFGFILCTSLGLISVSYASRCSPKTNNDCPLYMSTFIQPYLEGRSKSDNRDLYTMTCKTPYTSPQIIYEWFVDGVKEKGHNSSTFVFFQDDLNNSANITCRLSLDSKYSEYSQRCIIPKKGFIDTPSIEIVWAPKSIISGSSYTLKCSSVYNVDATFYWKKGGENLDINTFYYNRQIIDTSSSGNYTCVATLRGNSLESAPLEIVVKDEIEAPVIEVVDSPFVDKYGALKQFNAGGAYNLFCSSPAFHDLAVYYWKKDSKYIKEGGNLLHFSDIDGRSDQGIYSCEISMGGKRKESEAVVIHIGDTVPPKVQEEGNVSEYVAGKDYFIVCVTRLVNWAGDFVTFSWKKGNTDLQDKNQFHRFNDIQTSDSGSYTCSLTIGNRSLVSTNSVSINVVGDGKNCTSNGECTGDGFAQSCTMNKCDCKDGYKPVGTKCISSHGSHVTSTWSLICLAIFWIKYCMRF